MENPKEDSMQVDKILAKSIILLYRESLLQTINPSNTEDAHHSKDLILSVIKKIKLNNKGKVFFYNKDILGNLKNLIFELLSIDDPIDKETLLEQVKLACEDDKVLYENIVEQIEKPLEESQIKRNIVYLRRSLTNFYKGMELSDILHRAHMEFVHNQGTIKDTNEFITKLISRLESLEFSRGSKDPAIKEEIDMSDQSSVNNIANRVKKVNDGKGILKTGWKHLNEMLQGGFRPGEFWTIGALKHNYKTGFTLSLFKQIAMYNKPEVSDKNKKPLLVRISLEDNLDNNMEFLYKNMFYNENKKSVTKDDLKNANIAEYISTRLQSTGFHIKMLRVDPSEWTYKSIYNKIIEFESEGYEVKLLMIDYLNMVSKSGCEYGARGTEVRDLFRRVRNFCSVKKITFITPHQLSTEAEALLSNGLPAEEFVREISGKSYYADSKQITQENDGELFLHKVTRGDNAYLTVHRGKHRIPGIIKESKKFMILPFPDDMPIPDDVEDDEPISKRSFKHFKNENESVEEIKF